MKRRATLVQLGRLAATITAGLLLAVGTTNSNANVLHWTGAAGAPFNWSNSGNWQEGAAPASGDTVIFDGTTGLQNNDDISDLALSAIVFNTNAGPFVIQGASGNYINMVNGSNPYAGVTNYSSNVQTFAIEMQNNRATWFDTTGNDIINTVRLWNWRYYVSGGHNLIEQQTESGWNGQILGIETNTTVILASVSTNGGPIGHGVQINGGGTLISCGPGQQFDTDYRADVTMSSNAVFQVQNTNYTGLPDYEQVCMVRSSAGNAVIENGSALGPVALRVGDGSAARVGAFDGIIRDGTGGGALALILTNSATYSYWKLGGVNSYSGDTVVTAVNTNGTSETRLIINGTNTGGGNYDVEGDTNTSKAYLCGSGFINANEVNVGVNGIISPGGDLQGSDLYNHQGGGSANTGTFTPTTGTLTITNNVSLTDPSSALDIQLGGTNAGSFDQLTVEGNGTFSNNNANLQISLEPGYLPSGGDQYTIVRVHGTNSAYDVGQFATLNGTPTDLSQGATFMVNGYNFKISYTAEGTNFDAGAGDGNDIMIQALPITAPRLTWRGNGTDNNWDNTTAEWWNGTNLVTFANGDIATFDDSGNNSIPVNLVGNLNPLMLTVDASQNYVFSGSGILTGTMLVTKTNTGTLTLLTDNNYAGATFVNGGTLQLGNNTSSGSVSTMVTINPNGVLAYDRSDNITITNAAFSGTGGLVHNGSGTMTITARLDNQFTGQTTNSGGMLQLGDGTSSGNNASIGGTVNVPVSSSLSYSYYGNGNILVANSLSGSGSVTYGFPSGDARTFDFASTVTNSTFNGTITVNPYTRVEVSSAAAEPSGSIVVQDQGSFYSHVGSFTNMNAISITGIGPGANVDSPQGKGALRLGNAWGGAITLTGDATIGGGTATILGNISDGGNNYALTYAGGTIQVGPVSGVNTYGDTIISEDYNGNYVDVALTTVRALNSNPFSANPVHMIGDAELQLNGNDLSIANLIDDTLSLGGTNISPTIANGSSSQAATLTVGSDNNSQSFTGSFIDGSTQPLGLTKVGTGTLTLSADSTSTGPVTVSAGTLALVAASGAYYTGQPILGSGSFSNATVFAVGDSGTLDVSGRSDGTLTLNAGQTLEHSGVATGTVHITGNVNIGNGTLLLGINRSGFAHDSLAASGTATYSGTLAVTNIGAALQAGDSFQLFPSGVSGFTAFDLETNDYVNDVKYTWDNTVASNGKITVLSVGSLVNTNPTNIVWSVSTNTLHLSWPLDHEGWTLETNSVGLTATNMWFPYPGSTSVTNVDIPIGGSQTNVFFRMKY